MFKQLPDEPQREPWGQGPGQTPGDGNVPFSGAGTDLDASPGLMGEELHGAGGAGLHGGSQQEVQLRRPDRLVQEEDLHVDDDTKRQLVMGTGFGGPQGRPSV